MNFVVNGEVVITGMERNLNHVVLQIHAAIQKIELNQEVVDGIFMDGIDITVDFAGHLKDHIHEVKNIEIRSISHAQFYNNVKRELVAYLPKASRAAESISDLFYGDPDVESWSLFTKLTEGISFIMQSVQTLHIYLQRNGAALGLLNALNVFVNSMETHLKQIDQAMQSEDFVLMADIIKYEIGDLLSELLTTLNSKVE